jgi:hypothetical protein
MENYKKKEGKVVQPNSFFKGAYSTIISVTWRYRNADTITVKDYR